jgi:hypothetical protein
MQRLVYSPSVNVYVKTDSGIVDLSDYVVSCSVNRKMHDISTAQVSFRNPKVGNGGFLFTDETVFHPMDPIIISMTRLRNRPVQVFTGYCDSTPYFQMYPGIATIKASCTLKRLLHTYWDPGLPFVIDFMVKHGWSYDPATGTSQMMNLDKAEQTPQLNDTGLGSLLTAFLHDIGGWDNNDIIIEPLPSDAIESQVAKIFDDLHKSGKEDIKKYNAFLSDFVKNASDLADGVAHSSLDGKNTGTSALGTDWATTIQAYSNDMSIEMINTSLVNAPHDGSIEGDRKKVETAASMTKVPFSVLWGVYGQASSWGSQFGTKPGDWFGNGKSYSSNEFLQAAKDAGEQLFKVYQDKNKKDPNH